MFRIALVFLLVIGLFAHSGEADEFMLLPCKAFSIRGGAIEFAMVGKQKLNVSTFMQELDKPMAIPRGVAYDVFFVPKGGLRVNILADWKVKPGKNEFQLADHLGTAIVLGDNLPRVESIVLTDETDPGPGEKGHRPIQRAADYKDELIAPAGVYSVWIVPANGAKVQRIAERIRVLAGRETRVGE